MIYLEKSQPAPPCLEVEKKKKSGDYKCGDVLERVKNDFKNKCYLCEYKKLTTINVEYCIAHKDLKSDWNNLFWSCGHCNNTKLGKCSAILNCTTDPKVETTIKYEIKPFPKEAVKLTPLSGNERVMKTVTLLQDIYNGTTKLKSIEASNLRDALVKEIKAFQDNLFDYFAALAAEDEGGQEKYHTKIKHALSATSNFTTFKRWIIRDNQILKQIFDNFLA